ncbi:MAG: hypothetical protein M0006_06350, partial [Magnetospirillum sp.]|nr:hypothetical protein [Magnetospirillum sp.]
VPAAIDAGFRDLPQAMAIACGRLPDGQQASGSPASARLYCMSEQGSGGGRSFTVFRAYP